MIIVLALLACGGTAEVRVADAPASDAGALVLTDGRVLLDRGGAFDEGCTAGAAPGRGRSGCVEQHFYVFPVVGEGWQDGDPVTAFVTCRDGPKELGGCRSVVEGIAGPPSGPVSVRIGDGDKPGRPRSGWEKAARDAEQRHHLVVTSGAPVVRVD